MGGAGIDSFWNLSFVAPPTGTVPAYMFGVLMSVRTEEATYRLWVYDLNSGVNKGFNDTFDGGVTIRGSIEFPVTIAGRAGHQGFTALYSNQSGTDLASVDGILIPSPTPGTVAVKNSRYYFAYSFDQYLHRDVVNPEEGVGVFGQAGISDGNPNTTHWSILIGLGGKGMVPGRPKDNWGIGYYYDGISHYIKDALAPAVIAQERTGCGALLQLRADSVVRAGGGPAGHQARTRQRHGGGSGASRRDQVLRMAMIATTVPESPSKAAAKARVMCRALRTVRCPMTQIRRLKGD